MSSVPAVTVNDLQREINAGCAGGAYYLYGADNFSVTRTFKELRRSLVEDEEPLNLHSFEGKNISIDEVIEACESLPVFAEKLVVTVCDLDLDVNKVPAPKLKPLLDEIAALPDTTVLIFYSATTDICGGKLKPTAANAKLVNAVEKHGKTVRFDVPTGAKAAKMIEERCSRNGSAIRRDAADLLMRRVKGDMVLAMNEADKLSAYSKNITAGDVELLTPENDDTKAYELSDAIASGNTDKALSVYHKLAEARTETVYLLYIVTGSILDIYRARLALDSRKSVDDVVADFGYAKNLKFRVTNAFRSASRTTASHMAYCLEVLMNADLDIKSGRGDPSAVLENAMIRITAGRK